ncbi:MAG: transcriptional regulator, partial [Chlorobiaceae bacterium]|nr:transcriptional regulator [Chlorobiaceae bacterium]
MKKESKDFSSTTHLKFSKFRALSDQSGSEKAWEEMLKGFPEQQKALMTPFIAHTTLAEGFTKAIPFFKSVGMDMAV